jgi:hypothetical protein
MGIFGSGKKDMAGSKPFGRGRYAPPCGATLELKSFGTKVSQDPDTEGDTLLLAEFGVVDYKGVKYNSFNAEDKTEKNPTGELTSEGMYSNGDTMSEVINTDDKKYGMVNSKELCIAVKHAYECQRNGKDSKTYSIQQAEKDLTNDEANAWIDDPEKNKELIGLLFKLEAWNVQRTNSQTKKPDNFTAKKYQSAV